jgi:hypothetical protein
MDTSLFEEYSYYLESGCCKIKSLDYALRECFYEFYLESDIKENLNRAFAYIGADLTWE